jgi:SagB-type dehydrogenase family enzyme
VSAEAGMPTVRASSLVYGDGVPLDDPAELFHEASKLHPSQLAHQARGVRLVEVHEELRRSSVRAVKRRPGSVSVRLPSPAALTSTLEDLLERRRSCRAFAAEPLQLPQLAALLRAGYGSTSPPNAADQPRFRAVPSGGALYPLDVYCAVSAVGGLEPGIFHYDPLRDCLSANPGPAPGAAVAEALIPPDLARDAAVILVIVATFWRSRFKYGLRGYRFTLLEAGHLAQNVLLAATSLGLAAVPVGGFLDRKLDALLGLDGLHEASIYAIPVGHRPECAE